MIIKPVSLVCALNHRHSIFGGGRNIVAAFMAAISSFYSNCDVTVANDGINTQSSRLELIIIQFEK